MIRFWVFLLFLAELLLLENSHHGQRNDGANTLQRRTMRLLRRSLEEPSEPTPLPTRIFTNTPTSPTGKPTKSPTNRPTIYSEDPSSRPTISPSTSPTNSSMPSLAPTLSRVPTLSPQPSSSPTGKPSRTPSYAPSKVPTSTPSKAPTKFPSSKPSESPTISPMPSQSPTTAAPTRSKQPSMSPSISLRPTITARPTNVPSYAPTLFPTDQPSFGPTVRPPTTSPSVAPTKRPSPSPSNVPTSVPSVSPTLSVLPLEQPKLIMILEGKDLDQVTIQRNRWQDITSQHVLRFYQRYHQLVPGALPINVTDVDTTFQKSTAYSKSDNPNSPNNNNNITLLEIEYQQTITLGQYRPLEEDNWIWSTPFEENSQDYVLELIEAWDLDSILIMKSVTVGIHSPSAPPVTNQEGISTGGLVGISVSIVLSACLIVGFLFWNSKSSKRPDDTFDINGTRPNVMFRIEEGAQPDPTSWDYNQTAAASPSRMITTPPRTPTRPVMIPIGGTSEYSSHTNSTFASDMNLDQSSSISSLQRRRTHRHQLPASAPGIPSLQDVLDGNPTNSEFTFTDSDGGGGLSDEGGVENYIAGPPNLPSMPSTPERFGLSPLSPLHIPDEEGQSSLFPRRESSVMDSPTDLLGLSHNPSSPLVGDFGLQVQELE